MSNRTLIQNLWTDTLHEKPSCRGLVGSKAPLVTVTIAENEIDQYQRCGYCMRRRKQKKQRR